MKNGMLLLASLHELLNRIYNPGITPLMNKNIALSKSYFDGAMFSYKLIFIRYILHFFIQTQKEFDNFLYL